MSEAISAVERARQSNRKVGIIALSLALGMLGMGYAAVPIYRIFCQVTGYGGTTRRVDIAQAATVKDSGREMRVRFDANVARDMPWEFKPLQRTDTVSIGARDMALFWARNNSDFCFTEQTLRPGEAVRMPVLYYIDPAILDDPDNKDVEEITLSYTFHVTSIGDAKALDQSNTGG
ncbi:MAG: cytochrome c oxidase assembly protein [Novosphingobium sp.]